MWRKERRLLTLLPRQKSALLHLKFPFGFINVDKRRWGVCAHITIPHKKNPVNVDCSTGGRIQNILRKLAEFKMIHKSHWKVVGGQTCACSCCHHIPIQHIAHSPLEKAASSWFSQRTQKVNKHWVSPKPSGRAPSFEAPRRLFPIS